MKYKEFTSFKKKLDSTLPPLCLIVAPESPQIAKRVLSCYPNNLVTFNATNFSAASFFQEVETLSLFSQKRTIYVEGIENLKAEESGLLLSYVKNPCASTYLILSARTLSNTKLLKEIDQKGDVLSLTEEKPWEKEKYLVDRLIDVAASAHVHLSPTVAKKLIAGIGKEEASLLQELEKLICYVGERKTISESDLNAICPMRLQESLWQLGEAIFRSDLAHSLAIAAALLKEGVALFALLAHLRSQVRTAMMIEMHEKSGGPEEVLRAFPYLKGNLLEKKIQSVKSYGSVKLKKALVSIFDAKMEAKNSSREHSLILELLLMKICE